MAISSTSTPSNEDDANQPLLQPHSKVPSTFTAIGHITSSPNHSRASSPSPSNAAQPVQGWYNKVRSYLQNFLASRAQHFTVLGLVTLDVLGIFADIFINLYECSDNGGRSAVLEGIRSYLGTFGLIFSCLFMVELIMSIWAFGWRYFQSWFHCFDATVIVAGFVVDVLLHGILEEIASLVIVLRLWRFFKIVEEFSVGAQEQMDELELKIQKLEGENRDLKARLNSSKGADEEQGIGGSSGES